MEETVELLSGNWRPLPKDDFQATRESLGGGQDRLTVIFPKAEGKQRFLRLTPKTRSEESLERDFLPREAILFPFFFALFGGWRQNSGGLKEGIRIMKMKTSPLLVLSPLAFGLIFTMGLPMAWGQQNNDEDLYRLGFIDELPSPPTTPGKDPEDVRIDLGDSPITGGIVHEEGRVRKVKRDFPRGTYGRTNQFTINHPTLLS